MAGYYILAISVLASLLVGLLVVLNSVRGRQGQIYGILTLSFITLSIANALSFDNTVDQLFFMRLVMFSATMSSYAIYLLVRSVRSVRLFSGSLATGAVLATVAIAILDWTPLVFEGYISANPPQPIPGPGAIAFFAHFITLVIISMFSLFSGMRAARGIDKKRLKSLGVGLVPIALIAPITGFILPILFDFSGLVVLSPLYTLIFVIFVGYAIARHGLFDIRLAAVRGIVYVLSLSVLAAVYYIAAYFISAIIFRGQNNTTFSAGPLDIFLALVLAFAFQPVRQFFDQITSKIFYRSRYDTSEFLIRLGYILTSTTELHVILEKVGEEICQTLKASGSLFLVYRNHHANELVGEGVRRDFTPEELMDLDIVTARRQGNLLVAGKLGISGSSDEKRVHDALLKRNIALVLPLMSADEIIGYLILGEHLAGSYTKQDTEALQTIANELVIAVQNARAVQAIRDLNAHLEQRVDDATQELRKSNAQLRQADEAKDEFVSMASHQLRTPLTSIKGYISMVLEGDAGAITSMQKQLLGEAFTSSERMVHLISDFLNVSRLQTGRFVIDKSLVNLADLVDEEVAGLKATAEAHSLKLMFRKPSYFPSLYIDEGKVHQVVMNFIDNAIYYSAEDTTITVKLKKEGGEVVFEVHDTGIGVPKEEQERLFTKFFRATNARRQRPDGTGIGLFLAKKVITAHGGSMVFVSVEGEGSTFGFRLPIKKLSEPPVDGT